jgi:hypothetical protein
MKILASIIAIVSLLGAAAAHAQSSGAPREPGRTPPALKPPPEKKIPEKLTCVFDRAWNCRRRGCLVETDRVVIRIDTKATTACQMHGGRCRRTMKFNMTVRRGSITGAIPQRGMYFHIDGRYRATVAQLRGRRVFAVYGQCKPATQ